MFKKPDPELIWLQQELLAAEEEEYPGDDSDLDMEAGLDLEEAFEEFDEEDYQEYSDFGGREEEPDYSNFQAVYGRSRPKKFSDDARFEQHFGKARRDEAPKRTNWLKAIALGIVAVLELAAIIIILVWVASWAL